MQFYEILFTLDGIYSKQYSATDHIENIWHFNYCETGHWLKDLSEECWHVTKSGTSEGFWLPT